jgi:hypothetical protein
LKKGVPLFCAFLDIKKAFDSLPIHRTLCKMLSRGFPVQMLRVLDFLLCNHRVELSFSRADFELAGATYGFGSLHSASAENATSTLPSSLASVPSFSSSGSPPSSLSPPPQSSPNHSCRPSIDIERGALQGSILGPLLWLCFSNDLIEDVEGFLSDNDPGLVSLLPSLLSPLCSSWFADDGASLSTSRSTLASCLRLSLESGGSVGGEESYRVCSYQERCGAAVKAEKGFLSLCSLLLLSITPIIIIFSPSSQFA